MGIRIRTLKGTEHLSSGIADTLNIKQTKKKTEKLNTICCK